MVDRVEVSSEVITWAKHRSRVDEASLMRRFPKLPEWELGERMPTRKQLENFARATHVSVDYLLLEEPPEEHLPIPDHRTSTANADGPLPPPSPNLLDTIAQCQQRQDWYRAFAASEFGDGNPEFVRTCSIDTPVADAAAVMRQTLEFDVQQRGPASADALRLLSDKAEALGVLVMINGVVGSNTRRKLDPQEFRGFALADPQVPLVFINGSDLRAAQLFTLAHELAHLWVGQTALSDADLAATPALASERWCSQVATEFLVPSSALPGEADLDVESEGELEAVAKECRVSTLVVLRRLHDAGRLSDDRYRRAHREELDALLERLAGRSGGGGNFYNTQPVRVSKRFARALLSSTLAGETPPNDAFQMLGFRKLSTLHELARRMGVS